MRNLTVRETKKRLPESVYFWLLDTSFFSKWFFLVSTPTFRQGNFRPTWINTSIISFQRFKVSSYPFKPRSTCLTLADDTSSVNIFMAMGLRVIFLAFCKFFLINRKYTITMASFFVLFLQYKTIVLMWIHCPAVLLFVFLYSVWFMSFKVS